MEVKKKEQLTAFMNIIKSLYVNGFVNISRECCYGSEYTLCA